MPNEARVNPKIKIDVAPDGEVHIHFDFDLSMLQMFAHAFLEVSDGKADIDEVGLSMVLRDKVGVDYLIKQLQEARARLWPDG